jgi:hypothetical protein
MWAAYLLPYFTITYFYPILTGLFNERHDS